MLAITEEHHELATSVQRWAERHAPPAAARAAVDDPVAEPVWSTLAAQGLLGLHVPERFGGGGYGDLELAVVVERLGRALVPGPVLPTLHLSHVLATEAVEPLAGKLLPGLASGQLRGAVGLEPSLRATGSGSDLVLDGTIRPVVSAGQADVLLVGGRGDDGTQVWAIVDAADAEVTPLPSLDATRPVAEVTLRAIRVPRERQLPSVRAGVVRDVAVLLYGAEAAGLAGWACDEAAGYAKVREQFGRPIGQFQAVKHLCADLLVRAEQARAVVWDLATAGDDGDQRTLATGVAAAVAIDAAVSVHARRHPDPRRHRVHLRARRSPLPQASHSDSPAARWPRRVEPSGRGGSARWRSPTFRTPARRRRRGAGAPHGGPRPPRVAAGRGP